MSGTIIQPRAPVAAAGEIVGVTLQNAGAGSLAAGVTTFGQAFVAGDLQAGATLMARIGGALVPVQVDAKTFHADGSVKFAVLSLARPALAAGESLQVVLRSAEPAAASPAINLDAALTGRSFVVEITPQGGATQSIDVLAALRQAVADGTASFWQQGPLATEARVSVDLAGSQRLVFDVTAHAGGGFSVQAQFNNDKAMGATGGAVTYTAVVRMDGLEVDRKTVTQAQYQNWRELYASNEANGGQGLGDPSRGWLNIQHDIPYLQATGAIARYDLTLGVREATLEGWGAAAAAAGWGEPLANNGVTQFMPMGGARADIGIVTAANSAWIIAQDARAAAFALGQAEAAAAVPWNFWDSANGTWLNTINYPRLWTDGRGGTGTPGDPNSRGLTQQVSGTTGWATSSAHQPELSFVPYLLTGDRAILDTLMAQASFSVMGVWPAPRLSGEGLVVNDMQVRAAAWSLRQIENALWAAPEGGAERAFLESVSSSNWKWLVSQIPAWTAMQGEAHGWLPGIYGNLGNIGPWQQDYFASTVISAASRGNADALTFLNWQSNFLVGRFLQGENGFHPHDGAAYRIAVSPGNGAPFFQTWAEIGAATAARGQSNGDGWSQSVGDYARLAAGTLAGIHLLTGSEVALAAYRVLTTGSAPGITHFWLTREPQYAVTIPGLYSGTIRGTEENDLVAPRSGGPTLDIDLGGGSDIMQLGPGNNTGSVRNVEVLLGNSGSDLITIEGAQSGSFVNLGAGADTVFVNGGGPVSVTNVERVLGGARNDHVILTDTIANAIVLDLGGGRDILELAAPGNTVSVRNVETILGSSGADSVTLLTGLADGLVDLGGGADVLRMSNLGNQATIRGAETVLGFGGVDDITLEAAPSGSWVDLGSGADILRLANGTNAVTAANVETVLGGTGDDAVTVLAAAPGSLFDLGAGQDVLRLSGTGGMSVRAAGVETILGGAANESVTLLTQIVGGLVSLGAGNDALQLGNFANRALVANVETILGGTGADWVILQSAALPGMLVDLGAGNDTLRLGVFNNTVTVRNVETIIGSGLADVVTLGTVAAGTAVNLGAGQDRLNLANGGNRLTATLVETVIGGTGADDVTFGAATMLASFVDLGAGADILRLANGTNTVTVANVETVLGGTGDDRITVTGTLGARVEGRGGADVVVGGAGADTIIGGAGADTLSGGGGADWFIFALGDSALSNPDVINDFNAGQGDRVIVAGIDMRDFAQRGEAAFASGGGPQMRFLEATRRAEFDIDGNGIADLAIILQTGTATALRQVTGDIM